MAKSGDPSPDEARRPPYAADRIVIAGRIVGSLGMVALLSTVLTYALTRELGWMIYGKLIFGAGALAFYLFTSSGDLVRFFGSRSTVYTTASILTAIGFVTAMAALNFIGATYGRELDLTKEKIFSLSDQTEGVLARLDRDVELIAFFRPGDPERGAVDEMVGRYRARTAHVLLTFINPEKDPEAVKQHKITEAGPRIVVRSGSQEVKVKEASEEALTNAIVRVAERSSKKILFLTGHGEADIHGVEAEGFKDAADALRDEGHEVDVVSLLDKSAVPEGAGAIIVAAPKRELLPPEIAMLQGFLIRGGHVMVMLEPSEAGGLESFLAEWRIGIGDDMVVDPNPMSRAFGFGPEMPIVQKLEKHAITRGMKSSVALPTVRSVNGMSGSVEGITATEVVRTSPDSWGETRFRGGQTPSRDAADFGGPVPVMTAATKGAKGIATKVSDRARLLVIGDHDFATNRFLPVLGNRDLFLNAVNWLVEEEERIAIRPRARGASRLLLTDREAGVIKFFSIDLVPMVILAVGVAVWQVRRRR